MSSAPSISHAAPMNDTTAPSQAAECSFILSISVRAPTELKKKIKNTQKIKNLNIVMFKTPVSFSVATCL